MNNKIQEIKAKRAQESQKVQVLKRNNYEKAGLNLRTDRLPRH